jgi:hypothetical protein
MLQQAAEVRKTAGALNHGVNADLHNIYACIYIYIYIYIYIHTHVHTYMCTDIYMLQQAAKVRKTAGALNHGVNADPHTTHTHTHFLTISLIHAYELTRTCPTHIYVLTYTRSHRQQIHTCTYGLTRTCNDTHKRTHVYMHLRHPK